LTYDKSVDIYLAPIASEKGRLGEFVLPEEVSPSPSNRLTGGKTNMDVYWVDGKFVKEDQALISVKDIAILRGYGVFDFMRTYNRRPFFLGAHIDRLLNSARHIGLPIPYRKDEVYSIVEETIARNPHLEEANIRIVFTGGISSDGVCPEGEGKLIVYVTHKHELPEWWYTDGVKTITVDVERYIPEAKSTNYMNAVIANMTAKQENAIEALYVDRNQKVLEGTTTNVYFFKSRRLITPNSDILAGVTRTVILNRLPVRDLFEIELRDVHQSELSAMDEMFISASNKEIVPVVKVDDLAIGRGQPGPNTREIIRLFREYTEAYGKGLNVE
jgi:branched-chain amino acid aminotransferase